MRDECSNCRWSEKTFDVGVTWCEYHEDHKPSDYICDDYKNKEQKERRGSMKGDTK